MNWRGILFQALFTTALWGLGMHFVFDWPREGMLPKLAVFAVVMVGLLVLIDLVMQRRKQN